MARSVAMTPIDELVPAVRNPKGHAIDELRASFERFGYAELIMIDERTGRIVAGHGRLEALAALRDAGESAPDGVEVKAKTWKVPVVRGWASKDDIEAEAYLVASNQLTAVGGWDNAELFAVLSELDAQASLIGTGFDNDDLLRLAQELEIGKPEKTLNDQDEIPDEGPPQTLVGDIWLLGDHRVICGDCRLSAVVDALLDSARFDLALTAPPRYSDEDDLTNVSMAFTSPPYASQRDYDESSGFEPVKPENYVEWFEPIQAIVSKHLSIDGSWFINIKEHCEDGQRNLYVKDLAIAHVRRWKWKLVDELCWVDPKNGVPGGWNNRFKNAWEPVFHFSKGTPIKFNPLANGIESDSVFEYSSETEKSGTGSGLLGEKATPEKEGMARPSNVVSVASSSESGHEAAFPVDLPRWFIRSYSNPGDNVFDPFLGSGSTLIAAHHEGRRAFGVEISPRYVDLICKRWQTHTGIVPVRLGQGPVSFVEQETKQETGAK